MFDCLVTDKCGYLLKASWAEQEQSLKVEMEKLKEKALDLQSQNSALHQELERVSRADNISLVTRSQLMHVFVTSLLPCFTVGPE